MTTRRQSDPCFRRKFVSSALGRWSYLGMNSGDWLTRRCLELVLGS